MVVYLRIFDYLLVAKIAIKLQTLLQDYIKIIANHEQVKQEIFIKGST